MKHAVTLILGDGTSPELAAAARRVIDAALARTAGAGTIEWRLCQAGTCTEIHKRSFPK